MPVPHHLVFTGRMPFLPPNQQRQSTEVTEVVVIVKVKVKAFPYSIPSVGPGADPGVQAVSPQVTVSHPPGGRLPLLSARPAVTSPAAEQHCPLAGTKLYCLVTEARRCEQLAQGCYAALSRVGFELATYWSQVRHSTVTLPRHLCSNSRSRNIKTLHTTDKMQI